ncbi:hypothetical protein CHL74_08275 [Prevotella sp. 885]|nr:hypothetical protein CHL74_08275 [Prevotella sp. 885]
MRQYAKDNEDFRLPKIKHSDAENAGNLLEDNSGVKRRRRAASLSKCKITKCFYKITPCCKSTAGRSVYILTNKCYCLTSVIARKV